MNFKRITAIFLCVALGVLCCACGSSSGSADKDAAATSSIASSTQTESEVNSQGSGDEVSSESTASTEPNADATLTLKLSKGDVTKFKSDRPYDASKESISLILVVGQSNFTTSVGFASELGGVIDGKISAYSEEPVVPAEGTCYSSGYRTAITSLSADRDMSNLCDASRGTSTMGGVTPSFGIKWNDLTGTKVVFVQAAVGAVGVHEWTPNPDDYLCECNENARLYARTVEIFKTSYEALSKDYNIAYTGYIWNQGEHEEVYGKPDCVSTVNSDNSYYSAYESMHQGFMAELDLDFGGISVVRADKAGGTAEGSMSLTIARSAQYKLCNDIDNLFMISAMSETCAASAPLDMDKTNTIHYSQTTFNKMGAECANNLYKYLGLSSEPAKFSGVGLYSSAGLKIADFDKDGKPVSESVIAKGYLSDHLLTKLNTLGTGYTFKGYTLTAADGTDLSQFVDEFGAIDWTGITQQNTIKSVYIKCVIE